MQKLLLAIFTLFISFPANSQITTRSSKSGSTMSLIPKEGPRHKFTVINGDTCDVEFRLIYSEFKGDKKLSQISEIEVIRHYRIGTKNKCSIEVIPSLRNDTLLNLFFLTPVIIQDRPMSISADKKLNFIFFDYQKIIDGTIDFMPVLLVYVENPLIKKYIDENSKNGVLTYKESINTILKNKQMRYNILYYETKRIKNGS